MEAPPPPHSAPPALPSPSFTGNKKLLDTAHQLPSSSSASSSSSAVEPRFPEATELLERDVAGTVNPNASENNRLQESSSRHDSGRGPYHDLGSSQMERIQDSPAGNPVDDSGRGEHVKASGKMEQAQDSARHAGGESLAGGHTEEEQESAAKVSGDADACHLEPENLRVGAGPAEAHNRVDSRGLRSDDGDEKQELSSFIIDSPLSSKTTQQQGHQSRNQMETSDENDSGKAIGSPKLSAASFLSNTQTGSAEIITAPPFESVKAALSLFGEIGDRKSQQQTYQTEAPATLERHGTISEADIERLQDEVESYRKRLSDSKKDVDSILVELENVTMLIKKAPVTRMTSDHLSDVAEVTRITINEEGEEDEDEKSSRDTELEKVSKEIEDVEGELALARASRDAAAASIASAQKSLEDASMQRQALVEEQLSLEEAIASAQSTLTDIEEQVVLLRDGKEEGESLARTSPPDRATKEKKKRSVEMEHLEAKLEDANASLRTLREELELSRKMPFCTTRNEDVGRVREKSAVSRSKEEGKEGIAEALALEKAMVEELEEWKAKLERAREESASLSAALLILREEVETGELERMHEREQIACATLASLQDEIQRVKGSLHRAQEGLAKALEAKEKLPGAIKQAAMEADRAKAEAEASREQVRRAKHEAEQERAATSTAMSRQAAALKEAEAARASEAMAMAELKALTESESHCNAARASEAMATAEPKAATESESQHNAEAEAEAEAESESESGAGGGSMGIITITLEEYTSLKRAADEAESAAEKRVLEVAALVEGAKARQSAAQERLANMAMEVEACRAELEAARKRGEEAQEAKLASEAALRRWRAEHEQQRLQRRSGNLNAQGALLVAHHAHNGGGDDDDAGDLAAMKIVTDVKGRERRGAGLDAFSQVLSLKVPIAPTAAAADAVNNGKVLPIVESVSQGDEKLDKKNKNKNKNKNKKPSLLKRLASLVLRRKAPVVT